MLLWCDECSEGVVHVMKSDGDAFCVTTGADAIVESPM